MKELFGITRDIVKARYALRTPAGFVPSNLPGWTHAVCVVQISPAIGAKFAQVLIMPEPSSEGAGNTGPLEFFVYVLAGKIAARLGGKKHSLSTGAFAFVPPGTEYLFSDAAKGTQLLMFQKTYEKLPGVSEPEVLTGHQKDVKGQPFLGDDDARLHVMLPDKPEFDLAVNIFTYQPGATLPFVETHVMEHGLLMLRGQGVYRLDTDYHPVQAGDSIWMAPYCPQWFVAMGKQPASYIYYKDVNRQVL